MPLPAELEESSAGRCFYKRGAPNGAFADASFDLGLDFGQACQIILARGESLFVEGFEVDGAEGADVRGELAVPLDEGALGDADVGGDAREAEAFGAHFEELVFSFVRMHGTSFLMV
jgi:hypothetical protein